MDDAVPLLLKRNLAEERAVKKVWTNKKKLVMSIAVAVILLEASLRKGSRRKESALLMDSEEELGFEVRTFGYEPISASTLSLYGGFSHVVEPHRQASFSAVNTQEGAELSWRIARVVPAKEEESHRVSAPFGTSHEWIEEGDVVETSGSSAVAWCRNPNDRFRVTLTEVSASASRSITSVEGGISHGEVWIDPEIAGSTTETEATTASSWRGWFFSSFSSPWSLWSSLTPDSDSIEVDDPTMRRRRVATSDAVVCKYVRRELRSLTDADRDRYLQAVAEVHRTPRLIKSLLTTYLGQDTLQHCSFFHGGNTFLTAHAAFQFEFERYLQEIDPSISTPYWDTTTDDIYYGADWRTSTPVLDWFSLDDSYFAGLEIPTDFSAAEHNAYGRMTQSYNNDPSRVVWRSDSVCGFPVKLRLPGCSALEGALRQSTLSDFRVKIETDFHSVLHPALGGAFDCEPKRGGSVYSKEESTTSLAASLADSAPQLLQFLHSMLEVVWDTAHASGALACPTSCDEAQPFEKCTCTCPGQNFAEDNDGEDAYAFLDKIGILDRYANSQRGDVFVKKRTDNEGLCLAPEPNADCIEDDHRIWTNLATLACSPGRVSPYMTPLASPLDPIFWSASSSFERIWAFKRLVKAADLESSAANSVDLTAQEDDDGSLHDDFEKLTDDLDSNAKVVRAQQAAAEALEALERVVIDASAQPANFNEEWDWLDKNTSTTNHALSSYCFGKAWTDSTPFSHFLPSDIAEKRYTQADLYEFFNPKNAKLPYIFEDFDWTHCRT